MEKKDAKELLLKDEVFAIVGAAMEVHRELGPGFLESVYAEALGRELQRRGIPFEVEKELRISYKGDLLEKRFRVDFLIGDKVLLELKAVERLGPHDQAQVLNYLRASCLEVGLLLNFGSYPTLEWKRMALTHSPRPLRDLSFSYSSRPSR